LRLDEELGFGLKFFQRNILNLVVKVSRVSEHRTAETSQQMSVSLPKLHNIFWSK
jgi:hypothetical protein